MVSLLRKASRVNLVAMDFVLQVTVEELVLETLDAGRTLSFELSRGTKVCVNSQYSSFQSMMSLMLCILGCGMLHVFVSLPDCTSTAAVKKSALVQRGRFATHENANFASCVHVELLRMHARTYTIAVTFVLLTIWFSRGCMC